MAKLIRANNETTEVTPANGKSFSLQELQGFVQGYIECLPLPEGHYMVVHEEGRLIGLGQNIQASLIAGQLIVGDVLICNPGEVD